MKSAVVFLSLMLLLSGCSRYTQTTSGEEYLSRYSMVHTRGSATGKEGQAVKPIDERVREAAAVEPILKFPARIGLARIDGGSLTTIPPVEAESWDKVQEKLGKSFGEFVPVSPIVARMASEAYPSATGSNGVIDSVRLGAARQHLDAVMIYEVVSKENSHSNLLAAAHFTIIGNYILPSKVNEAEGLGSGMLIDVMQGYPYGNVNVVVDKKKRLSSNWGWGSDFGDKQEFAAKVKAQAAKQVADETHDMLVDLRAKLEESSAKSKKP